MRAILGILAVAVAIAGGGSAWAIEEIYTGRFSSVAIGGHDAVAYVTESRPTEGSSDFEYRWKGAAWRFASQKNLAAFQADPEAYAPQYGGYCAYAVSQGATAPGDPNVWRIVDGKLYLNLNEAVGKIWAVDISGYIAKADANWPKLLAAD